MSNSSGVEGSRDNQSEKRTGKQHAIDEAAKMAGTTRAKIEAGIDSETDPKTVGANEGTGDDQQFLGTSPRQDGYSETQGSGYNQQGKSGQSEAAQAQQGYDPRHSGVRAPHNRPGERVDAPGRETGTSWGEDQQMGSSTDTSDRQNPAG